MGRHAEGWKLRWKGGYAYVRFSVKDPGTGKTVRAELATGERDPKKAHERAGQTYADAIAGRIAVTPHARASASPLMDLVEAWLIDLGKTYPANTAKCYREYSVKWLRRWKTLGEINELAVAEYTREGLTRALVKTIRKELSALLGNFYQWCIEKNYATEAPPRPVRLLKKSLGKRTGPQREHRVEVSREQIEAFLAAVPEWTGKEPKKWRGQDALRFMYETGLRPITVSKISVPENWAPGSKVLLVDDPMDKAHFGRELPLSKGALAALKRSAKVGLVWGPHIYRSTFAKAIAKAGTPAGFSLYDIRHARGQHLVDAGAPLTGVAFLLGHKRLTTTNTYVKAASKEAASALLFGEIVGKGIRGKRRPATKQPKTSAKEGT